MFEIEDREVQYPNRVQLVPVPGTTDQFDIIPVPGVITKEGTPLNKETLDAIIKNAYVGLDRYVPASAIKKLGPITEFTGIEILSDYSDSNVKVIYNIEATDNKAWYAFDDSTSTYWTKNLSGSAMPRYLGVEFKNKVVVKPESFTIRCRYVGPAIIQGSNDNETWINISEEFKNSSTSIADLTIPSIATDYYKYIRIYITEKYSSSTYPFIYDFNFTGTKSYYYNNIEINVDGFIEQINQRIMLDISDINSDLDTYININNLGEKLTNIMEDGKVEMVYNGTSWDTYFGENEINNIKNAIVALGGTV